MVGVLAAVAAAAAVGGDPGELGASSGGSAPVEEELAAVLDAMRALIDDAYVPMFSVVCRGCLQV